MTDQQRLREMARDIRRTSEEIPPLLAGADALDEVAGLRARIAELENRLRLNRSVFSVMVNQVPPAYRMIRIAKLAMEYTDRTLNGGSR